MNTPGVLSPTATRSLLDRLGVQPSRRLGQNFLVDGNIVRKSLELARVAAGDRIVEIGPGLGTLTSALLDAGAEVYAIELDPTLAAYLREELAGKYSKTVHLCEGDAVERPLGSLPESAGNSFKIVANLPYAISSLWLERVLAGALPERVVLMLQGETARRYLAEPGSKAFGAISVFLQAAYAVEPGHPVARSCFFPVPEVDSVLLNLVRREQPYVFSRRSRGIIRELFQQRRKQLGPLLRRRNVTGAGEWLETWSGLGIRPDARAEIIPVAAWIDFDRLLNA